jgi:DNA end-binding protein Ku
MATAVWKGHITFGLVSIPVKLYRAARPERVRFRQLDRQTGSRVRQAYIAEPAAEPVQEPTRAKVHEFPASRLNASAREAPEAAALTRPPARSEPAKRFTAGASTPAYEPPPEPQAREVERGDLAKGYEYAADRFVMLTREELEKITPRTAREMQLLEFVRLDEVDPLFFETSYYVAPDRGGDRAYALLFGALQQARYVGVAQLAMHNREHIALIRPGRRGLILHTMFYQNEVHLEDEFPADVSNLSDRELDLARLLIDNLSAPFDAPKYRDTYKEKLDALIEAKIAGRETLDAPAAPPASVGNILEALQRTLEQMPTRKPPEKQAAPDPGGKRKGR